MADAPDDNRWGTIFLGPTPDRESTIDKVTENRQRELWNRRTEAEYMERVRVKATVRVQAMLDQARAQAEAIRGTARQWAEKVKAECDELRAQAERGVREAEALRMEAGEQHELAREEGYNQGMEQAMQELEQHRMALDDATASVLKTIESQTDAIFAAWRQELAALLRESVETATGWIVTEERNAVLSSLLSASVQALADRRRMVVRVNPQDHAAVELVIESAKARFTDLEAWEVRGDENIAPGGLLVESASGMVDNSVPMRREVVAEVLQHLTLPPGDAERAGVAAVAEAMERSGMNALAAEADARAAQAAQEAQELEAQEAEELARLAEEQALEAAEGLSAEGDLAAAMLPEDFHDAALPVPVEQDPFAVDLTQFPELQGLELPPDLPPDLPPALPPDFTPDFAQALAPDFAQDPGLPENPADLPPPAPADGFLPEEDALPDPALTGAAPGSEDNDNQTGEDDIPVLNVTVSEPSPEAVRAMESAETFEEEDSLPEDSRHGA